MTAYLYRIEEFNGNVELRRFPILRSTPCGVWIFNDPKERFVNLSSRKRFACPTVEEANL